MPQSRASAFTLFEIAIALALLAVAVTSVLLLFPLGIKAQQLARFRLYAAAKAEEMVEAFAATHNTHTQTDIEAYNPWDVPVSYRNMAHDLELRVGNPEFGLMPMPIGIARRLDADGDEIQRVLDAGGRLYYSAPMATSGVVARAQGAVSSNEIQKLVVAVEGYAQHDMMPLFPWKAVPYWYPYPSPPQHGLHFANQYLPAGAVTYGWDNRYDGVHNEQYCSEAEDAQDPDIRVVFAHVEPDGTAYGFKPYAYDYAYDDLGAAEAKARATRYAQTAVWYATQKALPPTWIDPGGATPAPRTAFLTADHATELRALRFLAHAGTCLTRWWSDADFAGGQVRIDPVSLDGRMSAGASIAVTQGLLVYWHESCLNLAQAFCAEDPYDWGAPRPLQHAQMMCWPLIEYDLMAPTARLKGTLFGTAIAAEQWRPLVANPVRNVGRSFQFAEWPADTRPAVAGVDPAEQGQPIWGDARRFTLTQAFDPCERCRQLVFWAVDWQAYEDFETAPSAPVDAGRYNFASELKTWWNPADQATARSFAERMSDVPWSDPSLYVYRNPEKNLLFTKADAPLRDAGAGINDALVNNQDGVEQGAGADREHAFLGLWGADRNFNKRLDKGPLPPSARMRAQLVGRFNVYDPRVPLTIR